MLILMMVVGALGTIDERRFVWAACFAGCALLAWLLLDRWRGRVVRARPSLRLPTSLVWRRKTAEEVAALCERRTGLKVDAASPATVRAASPPHRVLALAGDGLWVLQDDSRFTRPPPSLLAGAAAAWWPTSSIPAEETASSFPGPKTAPLVRGVMPVIGPAHRLAGYPVPDELTR